jgi:hypothetical protein
MKLKTMLSLIFIFFIIQTSFAKDVQKTENQPELKLIESAYTFETVTEGKEIIHDFIIKNVGNAQLDVLKVKPG